MNKYSQIITKLVQIKQEADAEADPNEIAADIGKIKNAFEDSAAAFQNFYSTQVTNCNAGQSAMQDFIQSLQNDEVASKAAQDNYSADITSRGADLTSNQSDLEQLHSDLKDIEDDLKKEVENLRIYGVEAEEKLVLLKYLHDIIVDELMKDPDAPSFIQLSTFNDKMKQLKVLLEKSHDSKFAPLVTTLLTVLETRGFSDQGILGNILNVLSQLQTSLQEFRDKQETSGKQNIEDIKTRGKNKVEDIKAKAHQIAEDRSNLQNDQRQVDRLTGVLALLDSEIARKQDELTYWNDLCAYADKLAAAAQASHDEISNDFQDATSTVFGHGDQ